MRWALVAAAAAISLFCQPALAFDGKLTLGFGRFFVNDAIGDGRDRWRSGAYTVSWVRGPSWDGVLPTRPLEIVEYRFRAEIIAPANLVRPAVGDRRYSGVLSFGAHTHFRQGRSQLSAGVDLVGTGPQTGIGGFQRLAHELLGASDPTPALNGQIGNAVHPTLSFAVARSYGEGAIRVRPFAEAQAGVETLVRVGADLLFGQFEQRALMLRDPTTGQLYPGTRDGPVGLGAVLGADLAAVASSAYLPAGGAARLNTVRGRVRAGFQWQGKRGSLFYGATYLAPEFSGQSGGQVLGALRLAIRF